MRFPVRAPARIAVAALAAGMIMLAPVACFSERSSGPGPAPGDCDVQLPTEASGSSIVFIRNFAFVPAQITVRPGGKVTWVHCGPAGEESHTSTADAGQWSSPLLAPGTTYTRDFSAAGAFAYHCQPHPGMRGAVRVE